MVSFGFWQWGAAMSSIPRSDWEWRNPKDDQADRARREASIRRCSEQRDREWRDSQQRNSHRISSSSASLSGHTRGLLDLLFTLGSVAFIPVLLALSPLLSLLLCGWLYYHGRRMLSSIVLLLFAAPAIVVIVAVVIHVHADPSLVLAGWQAHIARNPDQARWTGLVRDFVGVCRW